MRRRYEWLKPFLLEHPITIVDVGARGGSPSELDPLKPFIHYVGFDADPDAAKLLSDNPDRGFVDFSIHPFLVTNRDGGQPFHIYERPRDSSQLLPDEYFAQAFSQGLRVARTVRVEGVTLDTFCKNNPELSIDVIKLDTQGTEFTILEHALVALSTALLVECEVEFTRIYKDQKLFHDVCALLYDRGFTLLFLNRVFLNRRSFGYASRGQLVFGDALFGLSEKAAHRLSTVQKAKYCALLINYGLLDFAYELFLADPVLTSAAPDLGAFFSRAVRRDTLASRVKRGVLMQLDKVLALALHLRKTNQLFTDSDRAWPFR